MGSGVNRLTARFVTTVKEPGLYPDGGGLYLQVTGKGAKSWVLRYTLRGRAREMGLGSLQLFGLQQARERAQAARRLRADGIDPIHARGAPATAPGRTWGAAVNDYIAAHRAGWKNGKQADQWLQSLRDHGPDFTVPVGAIDTPVVLEALRRIWSTKTQTATRLRGRIERIWDAERVTGHVSGDNPARWRGHLAALLPKPSKVSRPAHFAAMPYADVPAFWRSLSQSRTSTALRFTILTASRTSEVTGMHMGEVSGDMWTVPAERMKAGRAHRVPLSTQAAALLPRSGKPFDLSENAMLYLVQREPPKGRGLPYTVHGFRSAFRDWASEQTDTPSEVVEMALAHTIRNKAEAAYRRGDLLEKRRVLMQAWADYLSC